MNDVSSLYFDVIKPKLPEIRNFFRNYKAFRFGCWTTFVSCLSALQIKDWLSISDARAQAGFEALPEIFRLKKLCPKEKNKGYIKGEWRGVEH